MNRYVIYDSNKGLFADDAIVFANTATEAVKKYMQENNISGKPVRSGDRFVRFKATKTIIELVTTDLYETVGKQFNIPVYETAVREQVYKTGNTVWFAIS